MCTTYDLQLVEAVVHRRQGHILSRGSILFSDDVPGQTKLNMTPRVFGTKNYRKSEVPLVSGCGQPTLEATKTILQLSGAKVRRDTGEAFPNTKTLILCSLREEPVIYLNGRPFTVRKIDNPLDNLSSFQGIDGDRVDKIETQLKNDILQECLKFRGLILVHSEPEPRFKAALPSWLYVNSDNVMTTRELAEHLKAEYFLAECFRVPLVPKIAPNINSFDLFMKLSEEIFEDENSTKSVLFYCQSGRGRTTFSIVVLGLIHRILYSKRVALVTTGATPITPEISRRPNAEKIVPPVEPHALLEQSVSSKKGEVKIILNLLRTFEGGAKVYVYNFSDLFLRSSKQVVDEVIDDSSLIQNIRDAILATKLSSDMETDPEKKKELLQSSMHFLQRYFYLIVFCKYLQEYKSGRIDKSVKFSKWLRGREEVLTLAQHLNDPVFAFGKSHKVEEEDEFFHAVQDRKGSVLSSGAILKVDRFHAMDSRSLFPGYSKVDSKSLHSVGQCNASEFQRLLLFLKSQEAENDHPMQFTIINLRLDPHIFVNGEPLVLRTCDTHTSGMGLRGMTAERLEQMELRLKTDIIKELEGTGKIVIHREDPTTGNLVPSWWMATPESVKTFRELATSLVEAGNMLSYHRIPLPNTYPFSLEAFDNLNTVLSACNGQEIIFSSETGRSLSSIAKVVALLVQHFEEMEKSSHHRAGDFNTIKKVVQVLSHGMRSKNMVDAAIDISASFLNIRKGISAAKQSQEKLENTQEKERLLARAAYLLQGYATLIIFANYLWEIRMGFSKDVTFVEWYNAHPEFEPIIKETVEQPKAAFAEDVVVEFAADITMREEDFDRVIKARGGKILQCNTILKSDHFPGCQKSWLRRQIPGAPNFRVISNAPIHGMGIPTTEGINNILKILKGKYTTVHWISLREEPVIYINGNPYVLRDSSQPFRNLEYSGISRIAVENMEERLQEDVLKEAQRYQDNILLTGEKPVEGGDPDHPRPEDLVCYSFWEEITDVKTPRQLVTELGSNAGFNLIYHRVPVTDEHSMEVADFDEILHLMIEEVFKEQAQEKLAIIFHCQMGQGRTTTGMIVATLLWQLRDHNFLTDSFAASMRGSPLRYSQIIRIAIEANDEEPETDPAIRYLNGDYNAVLDLVRAIGGGEAKKRLDKAIDLCDSVQNLRESIHEYYLKSETHPHYTERALNYLRRYFFLVIVSQFILEELEASGEQRGKISLEEWLSQRPELRFLENTLTLR